MEKWVVSAKRADFEQLANKFGIDPVIARLIRNRDQITDREIDRYLHGKLTELHSWKKSESRKKSELSEITTLTEYAPLIFFCRD